MKLHLLVVLLVVGLSSRLSSQLTTEKLDYTTYKPNDQKYNFLDYNFTINHEISEDIPAFSNGLFVEGIGIRNSSKLQSSTRVRLGLQETNGLWFTAAVVHNMRSYLFKKNDKIHFALDAGAFLNNRGNRSHVYGVNLDVGIGYGRVEILNEVEIAERLLEKLDDSKTSSKEDVFLLADFITELKNERLFTNRDDLKEELSLISDQLASMGYSTDGAGLDNIISKNYGKEPLLLRENGSLFSLKTQNQFVSDFVSFLPAFDFNAITSTINRGVSLQFENKKYINSNFQLNTSAFVRLAELNTVYSSNESYYRYEDRISVGFKSELHYLPNINSRYTVGVEAYWNKTVTRGDNSFPFSSVPDYSAILNLGYERRFRRNMRVALGLKVGYSKFRGEYPMIADPSIKLRF